MNREVPIAPLRWSIAHLNDASESDAAAHERARRRLDRAGRDVLRRRGPRAPAGRRRGAAHSARRHRPSARRQSSAAAPTRTASRRTTRSRRCSGSSTARRVGRHADPRARRNAGSADGACASTRWGAPGSRSTTTCAARSRSASSRTSPCCRDDYLTVPLDEIGNIESVLTLRRRRRRVRGRRVRGARELKEPSHGDSAPTRRCAAAAAPCAASRATSHRAPSTTASATATTAKRSRIFSAAPTTCSTRTAAPRSRRCRKRTSVSRRVRTRSRPCGSRRKGLMRWYASCCRTPIGNTHGHERDAVHRRDAEPSSMRRRRRSARFAAAGSPRARRAAAPRCRRMACRISSWSRACSRSCCAGVCAAITSARRCFDAATGSRSRAARARRGRTRGAQAALRSMAG